MNSFGFAAIRDKVLEQSWVYRAWQAPFAEAKVRPLLRALDQTRVRRVLDVGCGPGTNARHFESVEYVGVDINPEYIATARRRFRGRFVVGDVQDERVFPDERFDLVFANSLLHHLPDAPADALLARMARLVSSGGSVHLLDLVLPQRASTARWLARHDRGAYARPAPAWETLFSRHFAAVRSEIYPLRLMGVPLWWMIHLTGVPK
jgi:SAM-dependent methyltransferase